MVTPETLPCKPAAVLVTGLSPILFTTPTEPVKSFLATEPYPIITISSKFAASSCSIILI
jgi:hypothetical protein